ncbi:hypothetical protein EVAR_43501_1 [Eumeta japonica]|uniref:Uncharacterized protein n=1 Tax=Eumeta variegata TaxID=151549 RepID=A0A4C1YMM7_EUMVA|nr:hypothetical protein EVAR_43501_1 [Eumeta japonica]
MISYRTRISSEEPRAACGAAIAAGASPNAHNSGDMILPRRRAMRAPVWHGSKTSKIDCANGVRRTCSAVRAPVDSLIMGCNEPPVIYDPRPAAACSVAPDHELGASTVSSAPLRGC